MRKIAIIGGTGIYSPEALAGFEEKIVQTPYGPALCNIGEMAGNQVIFITRHGVGHKTPPHKVNYRANIWALKSLGVEEIFATIRFCSSSGGSGTIELTIFSLEICNLSNPSLKKSFNFSLLLHKLIIF